MLNPLASAVPGGPVDTSLVHVAEKEQKTENSAEVNGDVGNKEVPPVVVSYLLIIRFRK